MIYEIVVCAKYNPICIGQPLLVKEVEHDNKQDIVDFLLSKGYSFTDILSIKEKVPLSFEEFKTRTPSIEDFSSDHEFLKI